MKPLWVVLQNGTVGPVEEQLNEFNVPLAGTIVDAAVFLGVLAGVYTFGRLVVGPLFGRVARKRELDAHVQKPLRKLLNFVILFAAITVAFGAAGLGNFLQALATVGAAATLAIGFALQEVIRNFVSGVFIFTDKPFRIGDWIEWDGNAGVVEDISMRVTRVRTFDNELLTVPNSQLTDDVVKNPVDAETLRMKFVFGIGYDDDIDSATEIIIEEAEKHEEILEDPGPSVRLVELGDSSVGLQSRIWIGEPSRSDVTKTRGEYVTAVKQRFDEEGIDIPYPNRTIGGGIQFQNVEGLAEPASGD
jgi:small-conductance mechanosensitive channel